MPERDRKVDLYNRAVNRAGLSQSILTIENSSDPLIRIMDAGYDHDIQYILEQPVDWNFSQKITILDLSQTRTDWYDLPGDYLQFIRLDYNDNSIGNYPGLEVKIVGKHLYVNQTFEGERPRITYKALVTDVDAMTAHFREALEIKLAMRVMASTTPNEQRMFILERNFKEIIQQSQFLANLEEDSKGEKPWSYYQRGGIGYYYPYPSNIYGI